MGERVTMDESSATESACDSRLLRTRARWRRIRAATRVFVLYRRRAMHGVGNRQHRSGTKRVATSLFHSKQSAVAATVAAAALLTPKLGATVSSAPQVPSSALHKLEMFERLRRLPIHHRTDVEIKLLGEFIRHAKFFQGFSSASIDALAQRIRFRTCHEGEVLHRQGDEIHGTCGRYIVIRGSLLVYKNVHYTQRAREGEDYSAWYAANHADATRDNVKFGDCIDTCATGDTCGDDAILGHLYREFSVISQVKTVVAYITQADYKRAVRYNVENDSELLIAVRDILTPSKPSTQDLRQHKNKDHAMSSVMAFSPQEMRVLLRFLHRFACFRALPYQFCVELVHKLQLVTVKNDELVCLPDDENPSMIMVLEGKLCLHVQPMHEERLLKEMKGRRDPTSCKRTREEDPGESCAGCKMGPNASASLDENASHLCFLIGGDSFGELTVTSDASGCQGASILHPAIGQATATIVRLSRRDVLSSLQRYYETVDFNIENVRSVLSTTMPHDRTDEQVHYVKTFLTQRSNARLFFEQIPSMLLDMLISHAQLESYTVTEELNDFIMKEDEPIEFMRVVLNGYVGVFRGKTSVPFSAESEVGTQIVPRRAELRRHQSRLIRATTHRFDTQDVKPSPRRSSLVQHGMPTVPAEDTGTVDPVSILPSGASFGHMQIITAQPRSPYSYAAFASGPAVGEEIVSGDTSVSLLCIPSNVVLLVLAPIDDQLMYNPVRALKRMQYGHRKGKQCTVTCTSTFQGTRVAELLYLNRSFAGIPRSIGLKMIEDMKIVSVEARRVIYEVGDPQCSMLYFVVHGSIRAFSYGTKTRNRRGSFHQGLDDKKSKLPRRTSNQSQVEQSTDGGLLLSDSSPTTFDRPASDAIFLSDYSRTVEFHPGDTFGYTSSFTLVTPHTRGATSPDHGLLRRISNGDPDSSYTENVVTMSRSLLGVLNRAKTQCLLTRNERMTLFRAVKERTESCESDSEMVAASASLNSLGSSFKVLEAMGLGHRLPTQQRTMVASALRSIQLQPGDIVYKQGELSKGIYYVAFGSITMLVKPPTEPMKESRHRGSLLSDFGNALVDVCEGETFGDEAFHSIHSRVRACTAIAPSDSTGSVQLICLNRDDYDAIIYGPGSLATQPIRGNNDPTLRLLGLSRRDSTPKERWRVAVYQVMQQRAQRSQWLNVIASARDRRIDLLLDVVSTLPIFQDTPISVIKHFCSTGILHTFTQDTVLYNKSDCVVDVCFLLVQGSVCLYQTYYGNTIVGSPGSSAPVGSSSFYSHPNDSATVRVPIHMVEPGEIFGEYEVLEERPRRHINAAVAQPGTKLLVIQQDDFLAYWPHRDHLEQKLSVLKTQIRSLCRLDADQLCSLYHATCERSFRRSEVVSGAREQAGFLHVIQEGACVVHDKVYLQQKKNQPVPRTNSPVKFAVDTRVSTLGPGSILFSEKLDSVVDNRRASTRSLDVAEVVPQCEPTMTQYVVADSPAVKTLSAQLFPSRSLAGQRAHELLVVFLLGKSGLQVIRDTVQVQMKWRTNNAAQAGRVLATSLSSPVDRGCETPGTAPTAASSRRSHLLMKATNQLDATRVLFQDKSTMDSGVCATDSQGPHKRSQSPTSSGFVAMAYKVSSTIAKPTFGSFLPLSTQRSTLSRPTTSGVAPMLPSLLSSTPTPASPRLAPQQMRRELDPTEQLRTEERALMTIPRPPARNEVSRVQLQGQMRRRHGRPPPKYIENGGKFIDEHVVSPVIGLRSEHDRKKTVLCRRLLHSKGPPHR